MLAINGTANALVWVDAPSGGGAETDPVYTISPAAGIDSTDITNWDTAFGWGNHASAGYLTSYSETDPTVAGAITAHAGAADPHTGYALESALGSAAYTASTAYATAAQGSAADTAVQPGDDAADLGSGSAADAYVLTADGLGGAAWELVAGGGGTVTSVAVSGSDGIQIDSGSPITTSGTLALGIDASTLGTHLGLGTAAYTASTAYQPAGLVTAPSTPSDACTAGQRAWDGTYLYTCVASATWVRTTPERTW
jgi:hypothetical protein